MAEPSELQQLRDILVSPEASKLQLLRSDLDALENSLRDPEGLAERLQPILARLLERGDPATKAAILTAITPIIDRALLEKTRQDRNGISGALAPASTAAIALHYRSDPGDAIRDLAPVVGASVKEQIRGERDTMIDAIYPIIGSTIAKYLSETLSALVRSVNERIESRLSVRGIARRIRARLTGVPEAELLLGESLPVRLDAAFLIHKASGLLIARAEAPGALSLDPDLLSGMLTAIRTLFNDSMAARGPARELDQIAYGESKIVLEVAGFCYLAAVLRGLPDDIFRKCMRETLASIVRIGGDAVEKYAGDPSSIPPAIPARVQEFVTSMGAVERQGRPSRPYTLIVAVCLIVLLCGALLGIRVYRDVLDNRVDARVASALRVMGGPSLLEVSARTDRDRVTLTGRTSNAYLRDKAATIAGAASGGLIIENQIRQDPDPPLTILAEEGVQGIVSVLNSLDAVFLSAHYHGGHLEVYGRATDSSQQRSIGQALERLPGIHSMDFQVGVGDPAILARLYFNLGSTSIRPEESSRLRGVAEFLLRFPASRWRVVGHGDRVGGEAANLKVAAGRARTVRSVLISLGVDGDRLFEAADNATIPATGPAIPDSLSRYARFEFLDFIQEKR